MAEDNLQLQRFELKYRINAGMAPGIRDFVRAYLVPDEYSEGKPEYSYPNHSIYLDSSDLQLYWDVINANKNRYKLRLRFYDDNPESPVFFEIKRRANDAILKQRGPVRREFVDQLLAGHLPEPHHLMSTKPQHLVAVQQFCRLMMDLRAVPKVHVAYLREAWVSPENNSVRVTLDREVRDGPHLSSAVTTAFEEYVMPFEPDVILEIKFTGRFPNWLREMVEVFNVMQTGSAKYVEGVATMGEDRLNPSWSPNHRPERLDRFVRSRGIRMESPKAPSPPTTNQQ